MKIIKIGFLCCVLFYVNACGGNGGLDDTSPRWNHPEPGSHNVVSVGATTPGYSQVAIDNGGNSLIVWGQSDGTNSQIFKSEYRNGTWAHPANLTDTISLPGQSAAKPQVSMDDSGNAIVVWRQSDGLNSRIYKSEYRSGSWTHPSDPATDAISLSGQSALNPQVALSNNGDAVVVWHQFNGVVDQIYMSEYRNGTWTHPANLTDTISLPGQSAGGAQVAMDNNGNTIVTWLQSDGVNMQVYMSEYRNDSWTHPSDLATDAISLNGQDAGVPQVAMNDSGDVIIAWSQSDGNNSRIYLSEYHNDIWTHPNGFDSDAMNPSGENAASPTINMDKVGNALLTWNQSGQIYIREHRTGGWENPVVLPTDSINDLYVAVNLQVSMSDNGDAIINWRQNDGTSTNLYMSEYRYGQWIHPSGSTDKISIGEVLKYSNQVAMNSAGEAMIVSVQRYDGLWNICFSEYR